MEQQSKPTPGPWKYRAEINRRFDPMTGEPSESASHYINGVNGDFVGVVSSFGPTEANARMIAASPRMLQTMKDVVAELIKLSKDSDIPKDCLSAEIASLKWAIAEAEGVQ